MDWQRIAMIALAGLFYAIAEGISEQLQTDEDQPLTITLVEPECL